MALETNQVTNLPFSEWAGKTNLAASLDVLSSILGGDLPDIVTNVFSKSATILEPDKVQNATPDVPLFPVEEVEFPNGITILKVFLRTSEDSTLSVNFRRFLDPQDVSPISIVIVATSASDEAEAVPAGGDGDVPVGSMVMLELDTVNVTWMNFTVVYRVNGSSSSSSSSSTSTSSSSQSTSSSSTSSSSTSSSSTSSSSSSSA